ncbi:MAG: HEAT repeat domain-containing protein [Sedimentisphaerales bacterium]|nr:HEAT repeat domain-containing protein [Sedimentisphaerales bacterium]
MNKAYSISIVLSLLFLSNFGKSSFGYFESERKVFDYWNLTRNSDVIIRGTVTNIDTNIAISVNSIYKGNNVPEIISFATPPSQNKLYLGDSSRFITEETCIVFLHQNEKGKYSFIDAAAENIEFVNLVELVIKDVLKIDSLGNDYDKCKMLISLMIPNQGLRSSHAFNELYRKYNKEEFFDLFEPLENEPLMQIFYINLLENNPHPSATLKLRELLQKTQDYHTLRTLISSLRRKNVQDTEISKEIMRYVSHDMPEIRTEVIFTIDYRNYYDALPEITKHLSDEAPMVRASALRYVGRWSKEPDIFIKIKNLTYDKNEEVRATAYNALMWDSSRVKGFLFYKFLFASLFDKSKLVRRTAGRLDLPWEKMPVRISLLLLWPSIILTTLVIYLNKRTNWLYRFKIVIIGISIGYISGAIAGYFVGLYHIENPLFYSLILIPPFFIPPSLIFSSFILKFREKIHK